ncbi:hypothetical protein [Paraburkholderia caffeinilytica]
MQVSVYSMDLARHFRRRHHTAWTLLNGEQTRLHAALFRARDMFFLK